MGLSIGIVGLPNVGKSTLFNALCGAAQAAAANYPFCTIEPNVGVVPVPDPRLDRLSAMFRPKKTTPTTLEFVDIAGLVAGASKGEGLGNQFLANIREVDAIAHVLRCFQDPDVVHVAGKVDPGGDRDVVDTELMLKDLEQVERRRERLGKDAKAPGKPGELAKHELAVLDRVKAGLEAGTPLRAQKLSDDERALVRPLFLLTAKPVLYIANVDESQVGKKDDPRVRAVEEMAAAEGAKAIALCGKVEAELAELELAAGRVGALGVAGGGRPPLHEDGGAVVLLARGERERESGEEDLRRVLVQPSTGAAAAAAVVFLLSTRGVMKMSSSV